MNYKIQSDTLYTCDKWGNVIRKICDSVNNASFSEKDNIFVVTYINGGVETRDAFGNRIRFICDGAQDAKFQDTNIVVRTKSGNQLRDKYGNLIRRY
jgi:hypothetical protein